VACIKTTNGIVTQPSAPNARQAVSKAAQAPAAPVPYTPPTAPPLRIELSSANQAVTTAHRAVRQATSVEAVRQAVTDAANALYDARHARASGKELRTLTSSYRSLQTQARSKIQSLGQTDEAAANNDGTVFQTRSPRGDGKTDHSFNESGTMRDPHGHVVEGLDSTPEQTTYDFVRDVDGNVYIDRREHDARDE
jgi:hypothetical protein